MWKKMAIINYSTIKKINLGCHGIPDRCFKISNEPMPFCARCLGAAIGHVLSITLLFFGALPSSLICIFFLLIMLTDWTLQYLEILMSTNTRRLITGILGGLGVGGIIWHICIFSYNMVFKN